MCSMLQALTASPKLRARALRKVAEADSHSIPTTGATGAKDLGPSFSRPSPLQTSKTRPTCHGETALRSDKLELHLVLQFCKN